MIVGIVVIQNRWDCLMQRLVGMGLKLPRQVLFVLTNLRWAVLVKSVGRARMFQDSEKKTGFVERPEALRARSHSASFVVRDLSLIWPPQRYVLLAVRRCPRCHFHVTLHLPEGSMKQTQQCAEHFSLGAPGTETAVGIVDRNRHRTGAQRLSRQWLAAKQRPSGGD